MGTQTEQIKFETNVKELIKFYEEEIEKRLLFLDLSKSDSVMETIRMNVTPVYVSIEEFKEMIDQLKEVLREST